MKLNVKYADSNAANNGTSNGLSTITSGLSTIANKFGNSFDYWTHPYIPWVDPFEPYRVEPYRDRRITTGTTTIATGITMSRVKQAINNEVMTLEIDVPGIKEDHINIEVQGFLIKITGENEKTGRKVNESHMLTADWDSKTIDAELEDGILTLTVNKRPEAKPTKIPVKKK